MQIKSIGLGGLELDKKGHQPLPLTPEEQLKLYRFLKYKHFPNNPTIFELKEENEIVW